MTARLQHEVDDERGRVLHVRLDVRQHFAQRPRPAVCAAGRTIGQVARTQSKEHARPKICTAGRGALSSTFDDITSYAHAETAQS